MPKTIFESQKKEFCQDVLTYPENLNKHKKTNSNKEIEDKNVSTKIQIESPSIVDDLKKNDKNMPLIKSIF